MREKQALLIFPRQYMMGYMNLKRDYTARRYPPLGLLYVSSALKDIGYKVKLIDETVRPIPEHEFRANDYVFIGFYADTTTRQAVLGYIEKIRETSNVPILVGGPATFDYEMFLKCSNVIVCPGEGEEVVKEIAPILENNGNLEEVKGIYFQKGSTPTYTGARPLIQELDTIPFPDRSIVKASDYHDHYNLNSRGLFFTLITSRGCPMGCSYCSSTNFWGRKIRFRSTDNVIEEIQSIKEKYGVRYVDFVDDMINLNKNWLEELCDKLIRLKLNVNWSCNMFPTAMEERLIKKMKKAGANTIKLGVQSASGKLLDNIHRPAASAENAMTLIRNARRAGFIVFLDFIFGLPGETEETMQKSIDFAITSNPHIAKFYKLDFLEGSELYEKRNDKITELSDEKIREFCRTASSKFYFRLGKIVDFILMYLKNPGKLLKLLRHLNVLKAVLKS